MTESGAAPSGRAPADPLSATSTDGDRKQRRRDRRRLSATTWLEIVVGAALTLAVLAVHDVGYMFRAPFWLDEAWAVNSTRAPFSQILLTTSTMPIGISTLMRLVPGDGEQRFRAIPLLFACIGVAVAYLLGRELRLMKVVTGAVVAAGVLLAPLMLVRDDIKPYMADALGTLLMLWLLARLETRWSRGRLIAIAVTGVVAMLFTHTVVFPAAAVIGSVGVVTLVRREWRRLAEVAVVGAVMVAAMGVMYLVFDQRHQIPATVHYWDANYLPLHQGVSGITTFLDAAFPPIAAYLGTREISILAILAIGGIVTLVVLRRYALAIAVPMLVFVAMTASALKVYPFLDLRTSTFWLIAVVVLMAIGVAGAVAGLARWKPVAGAVALAVFAGIWIYAASPDIRAHPIRNEDVRAAVRYLDAHRTPGDVVVVNFPSTWGYAYYERSLQPKFVSFDPPSGFPEFLPKYPDAPWVVLSRDRRESDIVGALHRARALAAKHPGAKVWIVRSHLGDERDRWKEALARERVHVATRSGSASDLLWFQPSASSSSS